MPSAVKVPNDGSCPNHPEYDTTSQYLRLDIGGHSSMRLVGSLRYGAQIFVSQSGFPTTLEKDAYRNRDHYDKAYEKIPVSLK